MNRYNNKQTNIIKYNQNIIKIKFYMNRKNNKQSKIIKYNQNQI